MFVSCIPQPGNLFWRTRKIPLMLSALLLLTGLVPSRMWAQATSNSTVTGQVVDQQGAAVPGTDVQLSNSSTNTQLKTTVNNSGRYVFSNVSSGTYGISFSKPGFQTFKVEAQEINVGTTLTINATLQLGSTSTTIEVQAQAEAELQTTSASVGNTMSGAAILALPNLGRDVATLAVLQPGVTPGGYTAGAVQDQNTYTVDGGNNSDDMSGNTTSYTTNFTGFGGTQTNGTPSGVVPTPVESIEEFKVTSFNQTADFNSSMGSQVQMVTKRGTNAIHGAVYGYYFATNLGAANSWANNHTPLGSSPFTPLVSNHRDRYGAAIGGPVAPAFLGGKWYAFFNYEALRFPNVSNYERPVPSALMRAGIIQVPDSTGKYIPYNLNPVTTTVNGVQYTPAACAGGPCDSRGIGINPVVSKIWNTQMPMPNDPIYNSNGADQVNVQGYNSSIRAPLTTNSYVGRIDHDFSDKWHFMSSYRYMKLTNLTTNQVDIGGVLPGDVLGQPAATAPRTQLPGLFVAGLTTVLSPNSTNNFVFSYTRNFWQWGTAGAPPQLPGLGGNIEIASGAANAIAESATAAQVLSPYNVNTQSVRQRFWDGKDAMFKDDVTIVKGQHVMQVGGLYQRNLDYHMRSDNGNGVNNQVVYQVGSSGVNFNGFNYPTSVPTNQQSNFANLYSEVLGLVNQPQVAYTRTGSNLTLQPVGSVATDTSVIPTYNLYISDTWHLKPSLTLSYGLTYALELPPVEKNGSQILLVDSSGNQISANNYLDARKAAALAGQVYNPTVSFESIANTKLKYPYKPVWDEFSPRLAMAWNPKFSSGILGSLFGDGKTVIRGGYGRIFGRLNGVNLVLVPLLGPGLIQAVSCPGASSNGQCLGTNGVNPGTAFRIGTDGNTAPLPSVTNTLPQPYTPGLGGNSVSTDPSVLDPNYKPERTDNFTFSIQRAIGSNMTIEGGYIGRIIRNEEQELNIDAVPYMTTLGGQTFAQAYANTYLALNSGVAAKSVAAQPFFESAMGGSNSAYCKGYSSCTAAVASLNTSNIKNTAVSDLWKSLNNAPSWTLGRTMLSGSPNAQVTSLGMIASSGYGSYNAVYFTWKARDYHGMSILSNFTYGRALGTAANTQATSSATATDPFNIASVYGPNSFDFKAVYNAAITYQPKFYRTQKGLVGHILGGWTISPLFTAQSGAPLAVSYSEGSCTACQGFGESSSSAVTSSAEGAVSAYPYTGGGSASYNNHGSNAVGTNNPTGVNLFSNPALVASEFRPCLLGLDTNCGGYGNIRGLPAWNLDATALKDIGVWKEGRIGATLSFQVTNVLNHVVLANPTSSNLSLTSLSNFGKITGQSSSNTPRNMEFGLRIHF
jgi:Carboxypeptidase regulatory-like domain